MSRNPPLSASLRAMQSEILANIAAARETASTEPMPERRPRESDSSIGNRRAEYAARVGYVNIGAGAGRVYRVLHCHQRLDVLASDIQRNGGFRATAPVPKPRADRVVAKALETCAEPAARMRYGGYTDEALADCVARLKAQALESMRKTWLLPSGAAAQYYGERLQIAGKIETIQRELVRRGILTATDQDNLNAEPVHETLPDVPADHGAPLFEPAPEAADAAVTAAPEASEPAEPSPELVTMKTCYGDTVRILASDLASDRALLRTFYRDGRPKPGRSIHRDNLDPDGAKRAAMSIPPEIGRKSARSERDYGFRTYAGAERAIAKAGFSPAQFTIERYRYGGFIAVRINPERPKPTGATPPAAAKPRLRYCWTAAEWRKAGDAAVKASEPAAPEKASDAAEPTGPRPEVAPTIVQHKRGSAIVQCRSTDGWKTRTARLAEALGGRWVHKRNGYVMSASAAARLAMLHASGADASVFTRNITSAAGQPINKRTGRVAASLH